LTTQKTTNDNINRTVVGIDLGTTNSAVAYINKSKPVIIPLGNKKRIIPSVVLFDLQGNIVVGEDARTALVAMPDRTVAAVKRKMGSKDRINIAGQALLPQEISALILKELKKYVDEKFGDGEKEAIITVPAYFTDEQRRSTKQAGEMAGFIVERIINEPTAAALAFGLANRKKDQHILVYDLGGGTFDVSVVEMMSGILEVKASTGNNHLGGEDFDWSIVDYLAGIMLNENKPDPRSDLRSKALLKQEAENIKIKLSTEESVKVFLPLVTVQDNIPVGLNTEITQEQFVALVEPLLSETMTHVQQALKDANLTPKDIDEILLVGGSTRIPYVHKLIKDFFDKEPRTDVNPDEAVALGAAIQAGLKSGSLSKSGLIATDVAPFSMGIAVLKEYKHITMKPGGFQAIIPRNTTIPVKRTETFYTASNGQTTASIEIYQGEHEWAKHNHFLGEFLLKGIPSNNAGAESIDVTFHYNLNGILEVTAKCVSNEQEMTVTVHDDLQWDSQETFEESIARIQEIIKSNQPQTEDSTEEVILNDEMELLTQLESFDSEIDFEPEDDFSLESLVAEANLILKRAEKLMPSVTQKELNNLVKIINILKEAITGGDTEILLDAIDNATDMLIDFEL
jgi:molecular chaperone DnaK